ncbi:ribonuclease H-like protein [Hypoxylon sp. FL1857]|nr:ribonuclease H-like protein [Hypoxylon sp. FL1857]
MALMTQPRRARRSRRPRPRRPQTRRTAVAPAVPPATLFVPRHPGETPEHHFPLQNLPARSTESRFINRYDSREILILVDGSCINNRSRDPAANRPAAGCSFMFKGGGHDISFPFTGQSHNEGGIVGFPLEKSGPSGETFNATSNRAKLRAVIAALLFRAWEQEGWHRVVVATDLEYVVDGATRYLPQWERRHWRTRSFTTVANRDLWEELHGIIRGLQRHGTMVSFWLLLPNSIAKTRSALVQETKDVAREAATLHPDAPAGDFPRLL